MYKHTIPVYNLIRVGELFCCKNPCMVLVILTAISLPFGLGVGSLYEKKPFNSTDRPLLVFSF